MVPKGTSSHDICLFIRSKLNNAQLSEKLTIIDPYAFAYDINKQSTLQNPTEILKTILEPYKDKLSTLEIVFDENKKVNRPEQHKSNLENILGTEVKTFRSKSFHDRFWIIDDRLAFIVGASLNAFGNKHFFIQDDFLNQEDTKLLLDLYRKGSK